MNKKIRSGFIKELAKDSKKLSEALHESSNSIVKSLFEDALTSSISNIVNSEDEDLEEPEPTPDTEEQTETPDSVEVVDIESDTKDLETVDSVEEPNVEDNGEDTWGDISDFIDNESGEYDLTNVDDEQIMRVLKVMKPEDGVRVLQNEKGDLEVNVDDVEYVIEIDSENKSDDSIVENILIKNPKTHTNKDRKRTERDAPFSVKPNKKEVIGLEELIAQELNENSIPEFTLEGIVDDEVNEITSVTTNGPQARGVTKTHGTNNLSRPVPRNGSVAGVKRKSTSDAMYADSDAKLRVESKRLTEEYAKLKKAANNLLKKLNEAVVVNSALSHTVKLVLENSTTLEEKKYIINTFDKAKTIDETKQIYESLSREFNSKVKNNTKTTINNKVQIAESKEKKQDNLLNESVNPIKDLMKRLDAIK